MRVFVVILSMLIATPIVAADQEKNALSAFAPLVDKVWRGEDIREGVKPAVNVAHWEWILGGHAIRVVHALNDGEYGGQRTIYVDPETGAIRFHYVSNVNAVTEGVFEFKDNQMIRRERILGGSSLAEVRVTSTFQDDGTILAVSEYLLDSGEWAPGHHFLYQETSNALPVFEND